MLDHVVLNVSDIKESKAFYSDALEPLGFVIIADFPGGVGYGRDGKPWFWIALRTPASTGTHVALTSPDRPTVDAFHEAAIAAGGTDNGAPGLRAHYHPAYYAAFVLDPDGNNIEAVCHEPPA